MPSAVLDSQLPEMARHQGQQQLQDCSLPALQQLLLTLCSFVFEDK